MGGDSLRLQFPFLPNYYKIGKLPSREYFRVSSASRDSEIGLFTAWDARAIATGDTDLLLSLTEATYEHYDWSDSVGLYRKPWSNEAKNGAYAGNLSSGHYPNVFFLPYLLTGKVEYVYAMETIYEGFQKYRKKAITGPIIHQSGRELAWNLRTLVQLAYLERQGRTTKQIYIVALEATRQHLLKAMQNPDNAALNVLGVKINSHQCTAWMESYIHQVLNHCVNLGFLEWLPLVEWHFVHFWNRIYGEWNLRDSSGDHIAINVDGWNATKPYGAARMGALNLHSMNDLPPLIANGVRITYPIRDFNCLGAIAMSANNGIAEAEWLHWYLSDAIARRGDTVFNQEFAIRAFNE